MTKKQQPVVLDYIPSDDDGYTIDAYIAPKMLIHNAVRITYRPTPVMDRALLLDVAKQVDEKRFTRHLSEWVVRHLVTWDVTKTLADGTVVPLEKTVQAVMNLKPALWRRVVDIVCWGSDGGDSDPEWSISESLTDAERELQAVLERQNRHDVIVGDLQKN
jgi:hypothetical protein